jgi:hypothetical protein
LDFVGLQVAKTCCQAPLLKYVPFTQQKGTLEWEMKVQDSKSQTEKVVGKAAVKEAPGTGLDIFLPLVLA